MQDCEYVKKEEWQPVRDELYEIIHKLQDEVREYFTFQYHFVGSSKRNMITRDRNSNTGFDFDVNIEVNDPDENYSAEKIRNILRNGLDRVTNHDEHSIFGHDYTGLDRITNPNRLLIFGYDYTEDSTRVLTIKVKDKANSRILHSCDFCIVNDCGDGRQQYIRYNKKQCSYSWEYQPKGYYELPEKIEWIKKNGLWQQVRDVYLDKKNMNTDKNKKSRSIFAETVHQVCQQNGYFQ